MLYTPAVFRTRTELADSGVRSFSGLVGETGAVGVVEDVAEHGALQGLGKEVGVA